MGDPFCYREWFGEEVVSIDALGMVCKIVGEPGKRGAIDVDTAKFTDEGAVVESKALARSMNMRHLLVYIFSCKCPTFPPSAQHVTVWVGFRVRDGVWFVADGAWFVTAGHNL